MWKTEHINDCVVIEHNGAKRTYPKHGVDSFLLDFALAMEHKLDITTKQYNRLLSEYNTLLRIVHNNNVVDTGFWDKDGQYNAQWEKIESEEL